jgi:hypothetical protein
MALTGSGIDLNRLSDGSYPSGEDLTGGVP